MKFLREVAMVLSKNGSPLVTTLGEYARVEFPDKDIWSLHLAKPGFVKYFVHIHPPSFPSMSEEDRTTMKAWTMALSPSPLLFWVVSEDSGSLEIMEYQYTLETIEAWKAREKKTPREMILSERAIRFNTLREAQWILDLMELAYPDMTSKEYELYHHYISARVVADEYFLPINIEEIRAILNQVDSDPDTGIAWLLELKTRGLRLESMRKKLENSDIN